MVAVVAVAVAVVVGFLMVVGVAPHLPAAQVQPTELQFFSKNARLGAPFGDLGGLHNTQADLLHFLAVFAAAFTSRTLASQAQPLGLVHVLSLEMQESPHDLPPLHVLQHGVDMPLSSSSTILVVRAIKSSISFSVGSVPPALPSKPQIASKVVPVFSFATVLAQNGRHRCSALSHAALAAQFGFHRLFLISVCCFAFALASWGHTKALQSTFAVVERVSPSTLVPRSTPTFLEAPLPSLLALARATIFCTFVALIEEKEEGGCDGENADDDADEADFTPPIAPLVFNVF